MTGAGDKTSGGRGPAPIGPAALPYAAPPWQSPPTPEHLAQIETARRLGAKVRKAASVAVFSAWSTAIFAVLTLLICAISFSLLGTALGMGMALVAIIEFRGAGQIKRLDPNAPRRLAINQLFFAAMLFTYGAISLWLAMRNPENVTREIAEVVPVTVGPVDIAGLAGTLYNEIVIAVYGGVMLFAIISPGLTAWYYLSRRRYVEEYLKQTPQWILDLQKAGMSI